MKRLQLSQNLTFRLRNQKGRTGLTPALLCRLGFCLSLEEPRIPDPSAYDRDGLPFNASTLWGDWEPLFEALLRERLVGDGLEADEHFEAQLHAHLNRGAELICARVRELSDVLTLVPRHNDV
jgi:DNA sulfur modification protein DndE